MNYDYRMTDLKSFLETVPELPCPEGMLACYGIKTIKDLNCIVNSPLNSSLIVVFNDDSCVGLDCTITELETALAFVHESKPLTLNLSVRNPYPIWVNKELVDTFVSKDKYLYHFTKFDTAKLILSNMTLRFSELSGVNDINESCRLITFPGNDDYLKYKDAVRRYRQISLTMDNCTSRGFDKPIMWGHYAEKGHGICLVLDKQILLDEVDKQSDIHGKVIYSNRYDESIDFTMNNPDEELIAKATQIFFRKTADWKVEQEYRILRRCPNDKDEFLSIRNSLKAIIMCYGSNINEEGSVYGSPEYRELGSLVDENRIPILWYGRFMGNTSVSYYSQFSIWNRHVLNDKH